jgi:hypothetical protein
MNVRSATGQCWRAKIGVDKLAIGGMLGSDQVPGPAPQSSQVCQTQRRALRPFRLIPKRLVPFDFRSGPFFGLELFFARPA